VPLTSFDVASARYFVTTPAERLAQDWTTCRQCIHWQMAWLLKACVCAEGGCFWTKHDVCV